LSHGEDLRDEVQGQPGNDALVRGVMDDYRQTELAPEDRAILDFAVKLTLRPAETGERDLEPLRRHGFEDHAIHDIVQITGLFNYYNRLADGLGIDPEPEWGNGAGE
jgi:uncharacterized peroxidase-related enzyme